VASSPLRLHPFAGASLSPASVAFAPLAQAIKDPPALASLFGDSAASDAPAEAPAPLANCSSALGLVLAFRAADPGEVMMFSETNEVSLKQIVQA